MTHTYCSKNKYSPQGNAPSGAARGTAFPEEAQEGGGRGASGPSAELTTGR